MHKLTVRPFRLREHSHILGCDLLRGIGYVSECECGWRSRVKPTHREARAEGREHAALFVARTPQG